MIIGLDISATIYGTGVSNYTINLLTELLALDHQNTYKLFFSTLRGSLPPAIQKLLSQYPNVHLYRFYIPPKILSWLWNQKHLLPLETFIGPCDIFHTSDWTQPPAQKARLVTTVHDLTPFLYPQWLAPQIITNHRQKMAQAVKDQTFFICVSQNTRTDLLNTFPQIKADQTQVVYEAPELIYLKPPTPSQINEVKSKYQLKNYFLCLGTREPRKNLARVIQAFTDYQSTNHSDFQLAIAGKYGWGDDVSTPTAAIKILGYVPTADLPPLLAGAQALVYPSLYEGFGLPVADAFALGTPVITSNNGVLKEIANKSALLVDPLSPAALTAAFKELSNQAQYRHYAKLSQSQSSKFSWVTTAKQTLKIYQQLLNQ